MLYSAAMPPPDARPVTPHDAFRTWLPLAASWLLMGFELPVVYLVWLGVVAMLYPICRRYAELKARSRAWWLSYL